MSFQSFSLSFGSVVSLAYMFISFSIGVAAINPYVLETSYAGASFFDGFDFFQDADPTNGFVVYVDRPTAVQKNLISSSNSMPAYMGVDYSTIIYPNMTQGRASVRIESKNTYTHALIISDIEHMPGGICGTWPAHWTLGSDWPNNGEIDIVEGVNSGFGQNYKNEMTLHTSPGCTIAGANETGVLQSNDCDTTNNNNAGCGVLDSDTNSYGGNFNNDNGGVWATEWTSGYIRIWFFPRGSVPSDITLGIPDPTTWGPPQANFQGSCNIDQKFASHKIIFDTTFCGDYAGSVWSQDAICNNLATTCNQYVAMNPTAFKNAYWGINSVNVYQAVVPPPLYTTSITSTIPQSSVSAPGMGYSNYSTTTSALSPTATSPPTIGGFQYLGCASSLLGYETFTEVDNSIQMTLDVCISECGARAYQYAGVFGTHCYCSSFLSSDITITPGQGSCTKPCPGNINEFCGGGDLSSKHKHKHKRQLQSSILLSLYSNPALALVSVTPQSSVLGYGMGGGAASVITTVVSTTYLTICPTCPNGLATLTATATLANCGCRSGAAGAVGAAGVSAIPMTTILTTCACALASSVGAPVTLTVPLGVIPGLPVATGVAAAAVAAGAFVANAGYIGGNGNVGNGSVTPIGTGTPSLIEFTGGAVAVEYGGGVNLLAVLAAGWGLVVWLL